MKISHQTISREEFAAGLKMHRELLNLTQAEVATLLAVSPRVYWKWEHAAGDTLAVTMEGALARLKEARGKLPPAALRK